MSLINDALKKAARQRAEELADVAPPMPGGGHRRVSRHGQPMGKQTIVLIAGAAVALVVVSVVITGMLMTGKPEPKPVVASQPKPASPTPPPATPTVVVQAAPIVVQAPPVVVQASPVVVSVPKVNTPTPTAAPLAQARPTPTPSPVVAARVQETAPAAAVGQAGGDVIQGIVDRYRVSGVRAAGADSKALIDGHVYKVNEIIDRTLGLKLVRVEADHLTFVDRDGVSYVKAF